MLLYPYPPSIRTELTEHIMLHVEYVYNRTVGRVVAGLSSTACNCTLEYIDKSTYVHVEYIERSIPIYVQALY